MGAPAGATNVIVENSESVDDAACSPPEGGTAKLHFDNDSNVAFVNDSVTDVPAVAPVDLSAIDLEPNRKTDPV